MQILIIEDEPRAANQLQVKLKEIGVSYELLDIIDTVETAIDWLRSESMPDLIFMDIQLADGLSFEIFQHLQIDVPIIFTTAFDQYAIQAFKVNSIDYLLKPIKTEDLKAAVDKYSKSTKAQPINQNILNELLSTIQKPKSREGILVKEGNGMVQIKVADILYFYSEDSVTFAVTKQRRCIIDEPIDQIYGTLDKDQFYKINRGQLVAKSAIIKIEPYFNHRVKLILEHPRDQEFIVSRQRTSEFKSWMNF